MKIFSGSLIVSLLLAIPSNARSAHVYLSGRDTTAISTSREAVSPSTARLIFAQRLGLSDFHSLEGADEDALASLNAYGARQRRLFADEESRPSRAVVLVEDVKDLEGMVTQCGDQSCLCIGLHELTFGHNRHTVQVYGQTLLHSEGATRTSPKQKASSRLAYAE